MQGLEVKFAKKLAGNEKQGRDKALKKLRKWIELRPKPDEHESVFSEEELLKLWKGLFFCMWMSDKPLVQEQLAEELSSLLCLFPCWKDSLTFTDTFFMTLAREWNNIDNIRRDKYMMLVRRVLRKSLQLAAANGWEGAVTDELLDVYRRGFARSEDVATLPLGLQMHCVDIFLEEVAKVSCGKITEQQVTALLQPFVELLKSSQDSRLVTAVTQGVFHHLIRQTDLGIAHDAVISGEMPDTDTDDDDNGDEESAAAPSSDEPLDPRAGGVDVTLPQLPLDCSILSERLVTAGSDPSVRQKNRETLYKLASQFRDLSEGTYPLAVELPEVVESDSDLSDADVEAAVQRLKKSQSALKEEFSGRRKRRRGAADGEESTAETVLDPEPSAPATKKRKKLRNKVATGNGIIDAGERLLSQAQNEGDVAETDAPEPVPTLSPREKRKRKMDVVRAEKEKKLAPKQRGNAREVLENGDEVNGIKGDGDSPQNVLVLETDSKLGGTGAEKDNLDASEKQVESNPTASAKKQKKKKSNQGKENVNKDVASSQVSRKKKKKKKASDGAGACSPLFNGVQQETAVTSVKLNGSVDSTPTAKPQKKSKKRQRQSSAGGSGDTAAAAGVSGDYPVPASRGQTVTPAVVGSDWSVPAADDWGEPAPGEVDIFVPSKKAQKKASVAAKRSKVAQFVPSKPVAVFAKTRRSMKSEKGSSPKATSPITPQRKKLKICLNKNMEQTFKEHLITVRNSPGVPHNPETKPVKGLLKTPVNTPQKGTKTYLKGTPISTTLQRRGRSHAADFFGQ